MPSLRELAATLAPLLVIDASAETVQCGVVGAQGHGRWETARAAAGTAVFECVEKLGVEIAALRSFAFCEGPGSILGMRTTAMALRTWGVVTPRPVFAYCGLAVVAHALGQPDITVVADARRSAWHAFKLGGTWRRVSADELSGKLVMPEGFHHWAPLPEGTSLTPYLLNDLFALPQVMDADLFHATDSPDAFRHQEPEYATWTAHVHRAPVKT